MSSYSYKPSRGLEGASTVVPLCTGGFLEVRRGTKTLWNDSDERRTWPTLEEWKATLPADATVIEKYGRRKACDNMAIQTAGPTVAPSAWSPDFKAVVETVKSVTGKAPRHTTVFVHDNAYGAAKYTEEADREEARLAYLRKEREDYYTRAGIARATKELEQYRDLAAKELAKPAYSNRLFLSSTKPRAGDVMAKRLSDGEFVRLYVDMRRGVFFLSGNRHRIVGDEGSSFAEIGLSPVLLVRTMTGTLRMVSLEGRIAGATGGGTAVASVSE